jgi:hypothetical protein
MSGRIIFTFHSYIQWVNKAATRIGGTGAQCFDAKGRPCRIGRDFMRARDEGTFPVTAYAPGTFLDSTPDSKPDGTEGTGLQPTTPDGSASGVDRDNTAPTDRPVFDVIESHGVSAARANTSMLHDLAEKTGENGGGLDSISDSKTGRGPVPIGRCIGCLHDFTTGPCGGCGAESEAPAPSRAPAPSCLTRSPSVTPTAGEVHP